MAQTLPIASEPFKPQSMILTRTHEEDQLTNTRMMDEFEFAFMVADIRRIRKLLHDKGLFFGKRSKSSALALFIDLLQSADSPCEKNNFHINKGFNKYGDEVLEIRTSNSIQFNQNDEPVFKEFGEPEDKALEEKVFRFSFKFREGKIYSIQIPKDIYPSVEKFKLEN
jgi:hypothetical protein